MKCIVCGKEYKTKRGLINHFWAVHQNRKEAMNQEPNKDNTVEFHRLIEEEPTAGETNIIDKQSLINKIKGGK